MNNREERIRSRAYELWEGAGRPEGQESAHWTEAERQIDAENRAGGEAGGVNPDEKGPVQPGEVETVEAEVPVRRKTKASVKPRKAPDA